MHSVVRAFQRKQEVVRRTLCPHSAVWRGLGNEASSGARLDTEGDRVEDSPSLRLRRLEGKVALINGGGSGIGAAVSKLFGLHGAKVVVADIQQEPGKQVVEEIGTARASFFRCDATQEEQIAAAVDLAVSNYGGLDVLVNVVGGLVGKPEQVQSVDVDTFDKTVALNLRSTLLAIKHAARVMIPNHRGSIVTFGSCAGVVVVPGAGVSYSVSKFGVNGLAKVAASDLDSYGIRVNSIATTGVITDRILRAASTMAQREVGMEEVRAAMESAASFKGSTLASSDVAEAALFLASDESGYISGHTLVVDAGFSIKRDLDLYGELKRRFQKQC